jgi:hypothetical protein
VPQDPARFSEWQQGVVDGHMDGPDNSTQAPATAGLPLVPLITSPEGDGDDGPLAVDGCPGHLKGTLNRA